MTNNFYTRKDNNSNEEFFKLAETRITELDKQIFNLGNRKHVFEKKFEDMEDEIKMLKERIRYLESNK